MPSLQRDQLDRLLGRAPPVTPQRTPMHMGERGQTLFLGKPNPNYIPNQFSTLRSAPKPPPMAQPVAPPMQIPSGGAPPLSTALRNRGGY